TPLPNPTANPVPTGPIEQPIFTAYDAAGDQIATSAGKTSLPTDNSLAIQDAPVVGTVVDTGVPLADGKRMVIWFTGTGDSALLKAGERDSAGKLTTLKDISALHQPPFASGFYSGRSELSGPDGTSVVIG